MESRSPELHELGARLARLERENRFLKRAACVAVLLVGYGVLGAMKRPGPLPTPQVTEAPGTGTTRLGVVEVEALLLRGPDGEVAARLETVDQRGPMLSFFGKPGVKSFELWTNPFESRLSLLADGKSRLELGTSIHADMTNLTFRAPDHSVTLQAATESGLTGFYLHGAANEKGVRPQIGLTMPPSDRAIPFLSARNAALKSKVWSLD